MFWIPKWLLFAFWIICFCSPRRYIGQSRQLFCHIIENRYFTRNWLPLYLPNEISRLTYWSPYKLYRFFLATAFFVQKKKDFPKFWIYLVLVLRGVVPILIYLVPQGTKKRMLTLCTRFDIPIQFFLFPVFFPLRYQDNIRLLWEFSYYPKICFELN